MRAIATRRLRLVPNTLQDVRAHIDAMSASDRAQLSADWLERFHRATTVDPWVLGFTLVHQDNDASIGTCGFKGRRTRMGASKSHMVCRRHTKTADMPPKLRPRSWHSRSPVIKCASCVHTRSPRPARPLEC